jgi:hypothetical protein
MAKSSDDDPVAPPLVTIDDDRRTLIESHQLRFVGWPGFADKLCQRAANET